MFATKFATSNNKTCDLGSAQKFLGILSAKCPVFMGLLRTDYAELFLYDPYGFGNCDFMKGDRHVCSRSINVLGYLINLFVQS